jgi:hypothetical protein
VLLRQAHRVVIKGFGRLRCVIGCSHRSFMSALLLGLLTLLKLVGEVLKSQKRGQEAHFRHLLIPGFALIWFLYALWSLIQPAAFLAVQFPGLYHRFPSISSLYAP